MVFGTFNAVAFVHVSGGLAAGMVYLIETDTVQMFLTAPETKGKTLEEMDDVFDRGIPAWKTHGGASRLDKLQRDIEKGEVKVTTGRGHGNERGEAVEGTEEVETKA